MAYCTMKTIVSALSLWIIIVSVEGKKWDGLRSSFKLNPFDPYFFDRLPRTAQDATDDGFVKIDDCDASSSAKWRGVRYIKDNDPSLMLIYDVNGYIAGMQTYYPNDLKSGYPQEGQMPPFVEDATTGDRFVMSVYFVDPAIICTSGRTDAQFEAQGTGTDLYVQNGTSPEGDYFIMPRQEKDIINTRWTLGRCVPFMGNHYLYDASFNMNCHDVYPIFPLYNNGELTAFGFLLMANLRSERYEYAQPYMYRAFFIKVPRCTYFAGRITSIHIYLTDRVYTNLCGPTVLN